MPGKRVDRSASRRHGLIGLAVAVVAALIIGVSAYLALSDGSGGSAATTSGSTKSGGQQSGQSGQSGVQGAGSGAGAGAGASGALAACSQKVAAARQVVDVARTGVSHWHTHVQARTDMLDGRISVERMDALWKRTRLAGPADQQRFKSVLEQYDAAPACQVPGGSTSQKASDCATDWKAAHGAVTASRRAMGDWQSHLSHMAAFAAGQMTAAQAQQMWVESWRTAPTNIDAFDRAERTLASAPACS